VVNLKLGQVFSEIQRHKCGHKNDFGLNQLHLGFLDLLVRIFDVITDTANYLHSVELGHLNIKQQNVDGR
jgi:hypothetical protein